MFNFRGLVWGLAPLFILLSVSCTKEISSHSTVVRKGLLYRTGGESPFTGLVIGKGRESRHTQAMIYRKSYKKACWTAKPISTIPTEKSKASYHTPTEKYTERLSAIGPMASPNHGFILKTGCAVESAGRCFGIKKGIRFRSRIYLTDLEIHPKQSIPAPHLERALPRSAVTLAGTDRFLHPNYY